MYCPVLSSFLAFVPSFQAPTVEAHYRLDETTGTTVVDATGSHDGTFLGAYVLDQSPVTACTESAVEFDDAGKGYGSIPNGPGLSTLLSDLSVSAWVYPHTYGTSGIMRIFGNNDAAWMCGVRSTGLRFTTRTIQDYDIAASIPLNTWTHVGFVFDANYDVTFYVDGVDIGTVTGSAPANAPNPTWNIGTFNASIEFWDGSLDDIQIYDGSLSGAEMASLFTNPGLTLDAIPFPYCTPKSPLVCGASTIRASGCPKIGATSGFVIESRPARGLRSGNLMYTSAGQAALPFQGGLLCINPAPIHFAVPVRASGTPGMCNGAFEIDFNTFASGGMGGSPDPFLQMPGARVNVQWWGRDSVATGALLSDGLEFVIH